MRPWPCLLALVLLGCSPAASPPLERRVYDLWDLVGHDQAAMAAPLQREKLTEIVRAMAGEAPAEPTVELRGARLVVDGAAPEQHARVERLVAKLRTELRAVSRLRRLHDVGPLLAPGAFLAPEGGPLARPAERLVAAVEAALGAHTGDDRVRPADGWCELDGPWLSVVAPAAAQADVDRLLAALHAAPRGSRWAPPRVEPPVEALFRAD